MLGFRFFDGTDPDILLALDIRRQVFVEEQGIDPSLEPDDYDYIAWHLLALEDDQPIATARLVTLDAMTVKIGRVAVLPAYRGRGIARTLMEMLIDYARREGFKEVIVDSQLEAVGLYLKLGFAPVGHIFMDAGIPHQKMTLGI